MVDSARSGRIAHSRLLLFASGDFGFNLYWQSAMLYLLFYYTEALHVPITTAAAVYAAASLWDGIANFAVGVLVERHGMPERMRHVMVIGGIPLGASFALAYAPLTLSGGWLIAWICLGQFLFRAAYALVNVPYLAMSARVSLDSDDRAFVAGARMLFGTLAAVVVALGTLPIGRMLAGVGGAPAYAMSAICFATMASVLIVAVGAMHRDTSIPPSRERTGTVRAVTLAMRNRAFLAVSAAMMAMITAVTVLDKSILYYFKYALSNASAGQLTLGWMMALSAVAIPAWMAISRYIGVRSVWFAASSSCVVCLAAFIGLGVYGVRTSQTFLVAVQIGIVGLHFAFWAILPDTVEYGQEKSGFRGEAVIYGLSALLQRLAIGFGTLLVGVTLGQAGGRGLPGGSTSYRFVLTIIPLVFFAFAALLMLANPLRKGRHQAIVQSISEG